MPQEQTLVSPEIVEKIEKLIVEKDGTKKLNLDFFNTNVKNASSNLNIIVPNVVEVSKEQVAVINHGLEGVINFVRIFQTVNTSFALIAEKAPENPNRINELTNDFDNIVGLENKLIKDVKDTLGNLHDMLDETFREVGVYYKALTQIIYSTESKGEIDIKYVSKNPKVREMIKTIYPHRKAYVNKETLKRGLGLVQIIESVEDITKNLKGIKLGETENYYYEIKGTGTKKPIKLRVDVIQSLSAMSKGLISNLKSVGTLVQEQNNDVNQLKYQFNIEKFLVKEGENIAKDIIKLNSEKEKSIKYFIDKVKTLSAYFRDRPSGYKEKLEKSKAIAKIKEDADKAIKVHDQIIDRQIKMIKEVIRIFNEITTVWRDQVNSETHIGQVAGKSINVLRKLAELEVKIDPKVDKQSLLLTIETQTSIKNTCETAKELLNVGKIMQMLLKRLNLVVAFDKELNKKIHNMRSENQKADNYKNKELRKIKDALSTKYEMNSKNLIKISNNFRTYLDKINNNDNNQDTIDLFNDFKKFFKQIDSTLEYFTTEVKTKSLSVQVNNFEEYCKNLGTSMFEVQKQLDFLFDNFSKLRQTFADDYTHYHELSKEYENFTKNLFSMMDLINWITKTQRELLNKNINQKVMNYRIKAFQNLFDGLKKSQNEQVKVGSQLHDMMVKVGLTGKNYYENYEKLLNSKFGDVLNKLKKYIDEYFNDAKLMKKSENAINLNLKRFSDDFKYTYNDINKVKVSFIDKLFKTQKYKGSSFKTKLDQISKSLKEYDKKIKELGDINLSQATDVESFCKNSVIVINKLLTGYQQVGEELLEILSTMSFIIKNVEFLIEEGTLMKFKILLERIDKFNEEIQRIEKENYDLEEFDVLSVDKMIDSVENISSFDYLKELTQTQTSTVEMYNNITKNRILNVRHNLLAFFINYLLSAKSKKEVLEWARKNKINLDELKKKNLIKL